MKWPAPNLKTPPHEFCEEELNKLKNGGYIGHLAGDLRCLSAKSPGDALEEIPIDDLPAESVQMAKSHGIYLEFNRTKPQDGKDWFYMIRVGIPGGGPITRKQWLVLDELSERCGYNGFGVSKPSLKITTRQDIQIYVKKRDVINVVKQIGESGFFTLNGCGDNTRNVTACPLAHFSRHYDANRLARECAQYFKLPLEPHLQIFGIDPAYQVRRSEYFHYGPQLLNRKFKIAFSTFHEDERGKPVFDNCVELRTNDVGVAPVLGSRGLEGFQVYIGGSQGERNGKPTSSTLGFPLGIFRSEEELKKGLDAIVHVHEEWGDRQNRHWSRLKYVVLKQGIEWFRDQVRARVGPFEMPDFNLDYGSRELHHGWMKQPSNGLLAYGAFIECGRVVDGPNGRLKTMVRSMMERYPVELYTTPNQDLIFTNIPPDAKESFAENLFSFGYGIRNGKPYSDLRKRSGACVGLTTCRWAYAESEQFEPILMDKLEQMRYGMLKAAVRISGCERQCPRPATADIGLIGAGKDRYLFKLMGSEDARHQGMPVIDEKENIYLRSVHRDDIVRVCAVLFDCYLADRKESEGLGEYHRRIGMAAIIENLKSDPRTLPLMNVTHTLDRLHMYVHELAGQEGRSHDAKPIKS